MSTRTVTLPTGEVIRIRPYRPDDREQVLRIFSRGMVGLSTGGWRHLVQNSKPMQVLSCALPAAALLITPNRCGILAKAAAGLGAAAIVPCVVYAALRRAMKKYVSHSIEVDDLRSIETFYSSAGAGQGSAFWVAELLEQEPAATPPDSRGQLTPLLGPAVSVSRTALQPISTSKSSTDQLAALPMAPEPLAPEPSAPEPSAVATGQPSATANADAPSNPPVVAENGDGSGKGIDSAGETPDDRRIKDLVHGLVAAAVARFEGAASTSPGHTPSPAPQPQDENPPPASVLPSAAPKDDAVPSTKPPGSGTVPAVVPAAAATEAVATPVPGTPSAIAQRPNTFTDLPPPPPPPPPSPSPLASAPSATAAPPPRRGTIIGHVALERKSWKQAELRRMSVLQGYSGRGVGRLLLDTLVGHAREVGFRELVLSTSGMQGPARRLYERGGWRVTKVSPAQSVLIYHYSLDLTKRR